MNSKFATTLGVLGFGLSLVPQLLWGQTETLTRSYPTEGKEELYVRNINGPITVAGYDGNTVELTLTITRKGQAQSQEVTLGEYAEGKSIVLYVDAPYIEFDPAKPEEGFSMERGPEDYRVDFEYVLKVPRRLHVNVGTIQRGGVSVSQMNGEVRAYNVNGDIKMTDLATTASTANTVNGDITALHTRAPQGDGTFRTINGTIEVSYPANLGSRMTFESFNGEFFTEFDYSVGPTQVVRHDSDEAKYCLEATSSIQIGEGGPTIAFDNFNGDTYIRKR